MFYQGIAIYDDSARRPNLGLEGGYVAEHAHGLATRSPPCRDAAQSSVSGASTVSLEFGESTR